MVAATLRTRRADRDAPFALALGSPEDLANAATNIRRAGTPLWHLAFLNGAMARARGLGEEYLLFGAYAGEGALREAAAPHTGVSSTGRTRTACGGKGSSPSPPLARPRLRRTETSSLWPRSRRF